VPLLFSLRERVATPAPWGTPLFVAKSFQTERSGVLDTRGKLRFTGVPAASVKVRVVISIPR
jgi:hypothetical protein